MPKNVQISIAFMIRLVYDTTACCRGEMKALGASYCNVLDTVEVHLFTRQEINYLERQLVYHTKRQV